MSLEIALYSKVTGDSGISALMGNRFYPLRLPQNKNGLVLPAGVYRVLNPRRTLAHDGPVDFERVRVQIDIYAETYQNLKTIAEAFKSALNGFSGTVGTTEIHIIEFSNEIDFWADLTESYRVTQDYMINWRVGT